MGINEPVIIEDTSPQAKENIILSTQCLSNKFKDNPELKYVVTSVDRTGYDISAARSELMPSLVLKVNYNFEDKGFFPGNPNWFAGAGISLPLFHGGSIFAQIGQAKARQKQAIDAVRQTEISLRVKFESAIATAADKSRRLKTTKKVLELSKEALNLAELKYNTGKLSALDLIDAQTVWYNAMLTYENNTIDYLITLSEIEYICPQAIAEEAH
jgi:outer membrane protein TolC